MNALNVEPIPKPRNLRASIRIMAAVFALTISAVPALHAQLYRVLHNFSNQGDGAVPAGGVAIDATGTIYGVSRGDGETFGTVYRLQPHNGSYIFETLYTFTGGADGSSPQTVVLGPDGALYGSARYNGQGNAGVIFRVRPPATPCQTVLCPWKQTVIYSFRSDGVDAAAPTGQLTFDASGAIYGAASGGGGDPSCGGGCGAIYKLTPSGGQWTESVVYGFQRSGAAGFAPLSGVILDSAGNLYGTTYDGPGTGCNGYGCGTVYELTPSASGWTEQTLYRFNTYANGLHPLAGLTFDTSGDLIGATSDGGSDSAGTVFQLSQTGGGGMSFSLLESFSNPNGDPCGPPWNLTMDQSGNLYGVTACDTAGNGNLFKLTRGQGTWQYTDLYDFRGGILGWYPWCGLVLDAAGKIYGSTEFGGTFSHGTVWQFTPE